MYFMNYQLVRCIPPLFQFGKFNRILIIRKTKNRISNIYLPNILNLRPTTMGNKRKYKEIESDGPNESPKFAKRQKMKKVKTQVSLLLR